MRLLPTLAAGALLGCTADSLSAQLVISEVNFAKSDQWVELFNQTNQDIDLTGWSIYHATKTPNHPGDYWWPIPTGTMIAKNDFLRILWGAAIQSSTEPRDIYTGNTNWHFLFGHGFENLDPKQGALAICKTQDNKLVNNQNIFIDWLQWGATGFKREAIAINNKPASLWSFGKFIPEIPDTASVMLFYPRDKNPAPLDAYLMDYSPTPLLHNADPVSAQKIGSGCIWGPSYTKVVELEASGITYHGNKDFAIVLQNTLGPAFFERSFFFLNLVGSTFTFSPGCTALEGAIAGQLAWLPTTIGSTRLPLPILPASAKNRTVWFQAVVFLPVGGFSFSNRLKVEISK